MDDDLLAQAMLALSRDVAGPASELAGSMSGSGVYGVRVDDRPAVLKATSAGPERGQAQRELAFYRTLASRVPVRTPTLLDYADNDHLTVLLLSAHTPAPPAREWTQSMWLEVACQLAALHSMPAPRREPWLRTSWLRQVLDRPPSKIVVTFWPQTDAADEVAPLLNAPQPIAEGLRASPDSFVHGDCHAANVLLDGDQPIWTDWQGAGIGAPGGDLAFLWGRAHSDRADPPREAMLDEYAAQRGIDVDLFRRSLLANELGTLLFGWPEYASLHTQEEQDRTTQRLVQLAREWNALP